MAQSVERHIGNVEVTGPIPVSSFVTKEEEALAFARAFNMGFSLLKALEFFVFRKMEMPETKTHLLCGWSQIVIQKITFPLQ